MNLHSPWSAYRIGKGFVAARTKDALALSSRGAQLTDVDETLAKASAIITTINQDREDDVVVPDGIDLTAYAQNPVVLWDHGKAEGYPEAQMPLGMSEAEGHLCVYVHSDHVAADCYFHQKTKLSAQVCELVMKRWIRAASIGFKPGQATRIHGTNGHRFDTVEMLEWSWAPVGVNADAISRAMSLGRLAGEPMVPCLVKSFTPYVLPRRFYPAGLKGIGTALERAKSIAAVYKAGFDEGKVIVAEKPRGQQKLPAKSCGSRFVAKSRGIVGVYKARAAVKKARGIAARYKALSARSLTRAAAMRQS